MTVERGIHGRLCISKARSRSGGNCASSAHLLSALTIHHLDGSGRADLFRRLSRRLRPRARFIMGDVIVSDDPVDAVTLLSPSYDMPSAGGDLLDWFRQAGFNAHVVWHFRDLAVISADR
jgi:tRNA (cmo5U34)-methyltransferase